METFYELYNSKRLPKKVLLQITRARDQYLTKAHLREPTSQAMVYNYSQFAEVNDGSAENDEVINIASMLPVVEDIDDDLFDYGKDFDWCSKDIPLQPEQVDIVHEWLQETIHEHQKNKQKNLKFMRKM